MWPVVCQARTGGVASLVDIREHLVSYWVPEERTSRGSDLAAVELGDRHQDSARFDRVNGKVMPVDERFFNHWNHDPFELNTGGSGNEIATGTVFLLPYYMGLYHGFIK